MTESETPEADPGEEAEAEHEHGRASAEPSAAAAAGEATAGDSGGARPGRRRLRRPTVFEAGAFVALVGAIVGLVFTFAPGCEPQPPSKVTKATISDIQAVRPVTFRRYLQRQQASSGGLSEEYLARKGVMVEFGYEIVGLSGKRLPLAWELSDRATNELVDADQSAFDLVPSKNDDSGDWAVWIAAPRPGRKYYATVTIYKPEGPPYELKHFRTETFPGFARK